MKILNNCISIVVIVVCIILSSGCNKQPFDKRNKYIGNWEFTVDKSNGKDVVYNGLIKYGESDDALIIEYTENDEVEVVINSDNTLDFPVWYESSGEISRNKIHLVILYRHVMLGWRHTVDGKKEKWYN